MHCYYPKALASKVVILGLCIHCLFITTAIVSMTTVTFMSGVKNAIRFLYRLIKCRILLANFSL